MFSRLKVLNLDILQESCPRLTTALSDDFLNQNRVRLVGEDLSMITEDPVDGVLSVVLLIADLALPKLVLLGVGVNLVALFEILDCGPPIGGPDLRVASEAQLIN